MESIAQRVQALLAERGWTEQDLATKSGVALRTVQNLFRTAGYEPKAPTLVAYAVAFGITLDELVVGTSWGLPRRALELTDRALKADAEQSPEAAAAYKSWLESAGRKRLQELAAADEPDQYDPGGPASSAPPPRHPPRT